MVIRVLTCATVCIRVPQFANLFILLWKVVPQRVNVCHRVQKFGPLCRCVPPCRNMCLLGLRVPPCATCAAVRKGVAQWVHVWHCAERVPPCENVCHRVQTCTTVCHRVPPCANVFHRVLTYATVCKRVPSCANVCKRVAKCAYLWERVGQCANVCHRVPPCSNVWHRVLTCATVC